MNALLESINVLYQWRFNVYKILKIEGQQINLLLKYLYLEVTYIAVVSTVGGATKPTQW